MDLALVGLSLPGVENHSLAALEDAVVSAGYACRVVPFRGFAGLADTLAAVERLRPRVCGVSLQTSESALAALTFTRLLRARGYPGTIVVGGHFASLASAEILAAPAGVDVVVRLAGEDALVGLCRGEDPLTLPGAVTARGEGPPPVAVRPRPPRRERLAEHLGFGAADLLVSRGCEAHCGYCCVASVSDLARTGGAPRYQRRDVDAIADELAELAARGGRAFHFMDDNVLPLDPDGALAWVRDLEDALRRRRVPPIAFSLQLRADAVTPALAAALARVGLARAYVGIDAWSREQLRALGRAAPAAAGDAALAALAAGGVLSVANALIVGPTIGFETVEREIDALAGVRHAPVHLLPIEARPGTPFHARAAARGLIEGGILWPAYRFADERTFFLAEVLTGLPTRLAERSVPIALYDLAWALGTARRLAPAADIAAPLARYGSITEAWNQDQVRVLYAAAAAARVGRAAVDELLARERPFVRAHDDALLAAADAALTDVERAVEATRRRPARAHARGRLLGSVALAMSLAGCPSVEPRNDDGGQTADADVGTCPDGRAAQPEITEINAPQCSPEYCAPYSITATFDDSGVVTTMTQTDGSPLSTPVEDCLRAFFMSYCYPSMAGETRTLSISPHCWIA